MRGSARVLICAAAEDPDEGSYDGEMAGDNDGADKRYRSKQPGELS